MPVKPEQLDRVLDGFTLRVEHAGFQVYVDFSFHVITMVSVIKNIA
jgi:hypothetical protein